IDAMAELISKADRPVIYAGGGAAASPGIREALTAVAEFSGMPVVTPLSGQGVISKSHELYAGYAAAVGVGAAHAVVNGAHLILVLGSQLAEMETSSFRQDISFNVPPTDLIQVDIDPTRIGRYYPARLGVVSDATSFLNQLLEALRVSSKSSDWRNSTRFKS